ncbi:hypothetical protein OsJ_17564 [Oryza sativa Japonica Group]|uniref:Uncharacterized protein n=1 Tax=Oryza sativa subsp. japonica TaxID=39947 RepID=B9FIW3_ORYSJ|nr:hypothetical protein OsJ_17564 [Oryza sativa Japonica Group]
MRKTTATRMTGRRRPWSSEMLRIDCAWKSVKPTSIPAVCVHREKLYANTRYGMVYAFAELRTVERSFLVESPPGSPPSTGDRHGLMQVELLRPVAAAEEEGSRCAC